MRFYQGLLLIASSLFVIGCSNADFGESSIILKPKFTVIGEDEDTIYQYDFSSFTEQGRLINISDELGFGPSYLTLTEVGNVLTFYSFASNSFSARQYNVVTGEKDIFENFYADSEQRSITWGTNSEDRLFLGFYEPAGSGNLNVRAIDQETGSETDLFIENQIHQAFQPLYYNDKLFVTYQDAGAQYHIVIIENSTETILDRLEFGTFAPTILLNELGELVVIKSRMQTEYAYAIYDFESLGILEEGPFEINRIFTPGYLTADFFENKLYYQNLYAQPSSLVFSPAIYDVSNKTNTIIDLIGIVDDFKEAQQTSIVPLSQGYDPVSRSFLIGFGRIDSIDELEGGVLVISGNGKLIGHVDLPFVPTYFVKSTN